MSYDLGDVVTLTQKVRDDAGALANAGDMTLTITKPDATTESPVVANPSVGVYTADYAPTDAGPYGVRWVATGANAMAQTDQFDVRIANPPLLFSLEDAKGMLNKVQDSDEPKIRDLIESTTSIIEGIVGPVVRNTEIEIIKNNGNYNHFVTRRSPLISFTSIEPVFPFNKTYDVSDFDVDLTSGIFRLKDGHYVTGTQKVTYVVGRTYIPSAIRDAGEMTLRYLWSFKLGPHSSPRDRSQSTRALSVELPRAVIELLRPYDQVGGFA